MENCKKEFLEEVKGKTVLCAKIEQGRDYGDPADVNQRLLPVGFTSIEYDEFLASIDFDYDDGFGGQELFGLIWYADGTWSERGEYDGSEWWDYKECPDKPE